MSILVEQQDEQITAINDTIKEVEKDVETGYVTPLNGQTPMLILSLVSTTRTRLSTRHGQHGRSVGSASLLP